MPSRKNTPPSAPQPSGSGAVPGSVQGAEELSNTADQPPYTGPGAYAVVGEKVQPGVNDGTKADERELRDQPGDNELEATEPMVFYIGEFGNREITVQDWQLANVPDMPQIVWNRGNNFAVPQKVFSDRALAVLRQDASFRFA